MIDRREHVEARANQYESSAERGKKKRRRGRRRRR